MHSDNKTRIIKGTQAVSGTMFCVLGELKVATMMCLVIRTAIVLLICLTASGWGERQMENLDRGIVAVKQPGGMRRRGVGVVFLSQIAWRVV